VRSAGPVGSRLVNWHDALVVVAGRKRSGCVDGSNLLFPCQFHRRRRPYFRLDWCTTPDDTFPGTRTFRVPLVLDISSGCNRRGVLNAALNVVRLSVIQF
jgi:hypothetical protein